MKNLLSLFILMLSPMLAGAQKVSDVQTSGCEGKDGEAVPTIVLTKEGSVLSVQLLNYECNCCTDYFNVASGIRAVNDSFCSVSVTVYPYAEYDCDCICPFNVTFTIRDLEPNSFYLDCWWYKGQVELTEGETTVLEYNHPDPKESLYGEWWLVGWNDGGKWLEVDSGYVGHHHFSIEIPKEGYVMAYSMVNEICLGLLTLNGNEMIFDGARGMTKVYYDLMENLFFENHIFNIKSYQLEGKRLRLYYADDGYFEFTSDFDDRGGAGYAYRPFIEEGKVWKVGDYCSGNPLQSVEYYYFDGDTIIDGRTCKQMMCQLYVSPDHPDYDVISQLPMLSKVGAWYEEHKKVYLYNTLNSQFRLMYDFSADANDTLMIDSYYYVIGPRQTGGIKGFKGVDRDVLELGDGGSVYRCAPWLEGVGSIYGPPTTNIFNVELGDPSRFLMSCSVGDEVIYLDDEYEDGATPEFLETRKQRFDFTHTIKTRPKAPRKSGETKSLYGEYNGHRLDVRLDALDEDYQVSIVGADGSVVYEKPIDAGGIVALSIDISAYTKGSYTVTLENSRETFTGVFGVQTSGIDAAASGGEASGRYIYNLQGQRRSSLQEGLNIVGGKKVFVK